MLGSHLMPVLGNAAPSVTKAMLGRAQSLNLGWRFWRGDGVGFERPEFDDSAWRAVDVPHDWSIEDLPDQSAAEKAEVIGPFSRKAIGGTATGYTVGGTAWYRKRFIVTGDHARVDVRFDGVYMNSEVWINGVRLGEFPNGYLPFACDMTPYLVRNRANVIAVKVRNEGVNTRWFSGSGIYRHVSLDVYQEPSRIAPWGASVATQSIEKDQATLELRTSLVDLARGLTLTSKIKDAKGKTVWERSGVPASAQVSAVARIPSAALWSPDTPNLYTLVSELRRGKAVVDRTETTFGIRIVTFDVTNGMTINGKSTKLKGGCIHHDNGLLGAMAFDEAEDRKVRLLKARGYNAVRPSHNPFSEAFLSACDRHGLFVIAESFDAWRLPKQPEDYSQFFDTHWKHDLTTTVLSARHHPSIVMWSIGNEITGRNLPIGIETQWRLANLVHELDPYRPVTAAVNDFVGRPMIPSEQTARSGRGGKADEASFMFLDVAGYNYKLGKYERDHALYPERIMYGSESFPKDMFANWALIDKSPYLIGDFVWAAMDYLGEAGLGGSSYKKGSAGPASPGSWPWVNAGCGDLDITGHQRAQSLARDVAWGLSQLEVLVQTPPPEGMTEVLRPWGWSDEHPSWTWPGADGKTVAVRVYTRGDRVDLRLNGKPVASGMVAKDALMRAEFKVEYQPGQLEVVAYSGSKEIGRRTLNTASKIASVAVLPERKHTGASRNDIAYVAIELRDNEGRLVHGVAQGLKATVTGPAEILGFGSAAWSAVGSYQAAQARTFNGRAQLILRGTGRAGAVTIAIVGEGISGTAELMFG
jgi:beta-galactosidase